MTDKTGGPAFPLASEYGEKVESSSGMTLRDYFAAKAMASIVSNHEGYNLRAEDVAGYAYHAADAMIAERSKGE